MAPGKEHFLGSTNGLSPEQKEKRKLDELENKRKEAESKLDQENKKAGILKLLQKEEARKNINLIHAIVLLPGILFQFLQDIMINLENQTVPSLASAMRIYNSVAVFPMIYFAYKHYSYLLDESKLRKEEYYKTTLSQSAFYKFFILEAVVNCIHSPPGLLLIYYQDVGGKPVAYSYDSVISIFSLMKLYIIMRLFQNYSQWTSGQAIRICRMNGFTPDFAFAFKCVNRSNPARFVLFGLSSSVIIFGFCVQNFERQLGQNSGAVVKFADSFWNSMWCMILTMTTVGYGEIFPITVWGRLFTIAATIWGSFMVSMIIVTLTGSVQFTSEEEAAYTEICTKDKSLKEQQKIEARAVLVAAFRFWTIDRLKKEGRPMRGIDSNQPDLQKLKNFRFGKWLAAKLEFTAVTKRMKYKRLSIKNANPQLSSIIEDLQGNVFSFLDKNEKNLKLYQTTVTKQIAEIRQTQYQTDAKAPKMYDLTMRLNSFLKIVNLEDKENGKESAARSGNKPIEKEDFDKNKVLYTCSGALMKGNFSKDLLILLDDARNSCDKFYENLKPSEKTLAANTGGIQMAQKSNA